MGNGLFSGRGILRSIGLGYNVVLSSNDSNVTVCYGKSHFLIASYHPTNWAVNILAMLVYWRVTGLARNSPPNSLTKEVSPLTVTYPAW